MKRVLIKKDVRYHLRESGSIKLEYLIDGEITPTFIITKLSKQKDKPQEYELECLIEYDKLSENGLLKSYSWVKDKFQNNNLNQINNKPLTKIRSSLEDIFGAINLSKKIYLDVDFPIIDTFKIRQSNEFKSLIESFLNLPEYKGLTLNKEFSVIGTDTLKWRPDSYRNLVELIFNFLNISYKTKNKFVAYNYDWHYNGFKLTSYDFEMIISKDIKIWQLSTYIENQTINKHNRVLFLNDSKNFIEREFLNKIEMINYHLGLGIFKNSEIIEFNVWDDGFQFINDIKGNNSEILEFFTYEILDSLKLLESEKVIIGYNPNDIVLILNLETGLIERMSHEEAEFNIKNYTSLPIIKIKDGKIYAKLNSEVFNNSYLCKNILI